MYTVVVLNGPPGIGKDTIDLAIETDFYRQEWDTLYCNREWKETPNVRLNKRSPRQHLIHMSEDVIKPEKGNTYFGEILAESVNSWIGERR